MSKKHLIVSLATQGAGAVFCAGVSFLLLVFLGRALGPSSFGIYVAVLNTAVLALIFIEGGWPTLLYREAVIAPNAHIPRNLPVGHLMLSITPVREDVTTVSGHAVAYILIMSGLLSLVAWIANPAIRGTLSAALACMGFVALMNLVSARMRAWGLFGREALWQSTGRLVSALFIVGIVLWIGDTLAVIFLAWALGLGLVLALGGRAWLTRPRWDGLLEASRLALPFVAIAGLSAFLLKGDMALLGVLGLPPAELSFYAACTRLTEAAVLLFAPVTNVALRSFRLAANEENGFRQLAKSFLAVAMMVGLSALLGSWLAGMRLMPWLFGPDYQPAGVLLPWVTLALPFALGNLVLFPALMARNRERVLVRCLIIAAILMAVGVYGGSRTDGARGAALGMAFAQAILFVLCLRLVFSTESRDLCESQ